mgnify:CR=1 FL=1
MRKPMKIIKESSISYLDDVSLVDKFKVINSDMPRMGSFVINIKQV